jgi:protein TonB
MRKSKGIRLCSSLFAILLVSAAVFAQSGRRATIKVPVPPPDAELIEPKTKPVKDEPPPVTAETNQDYRCSEDGSLDRILEPDDIGEAVVTAREAELRATITGKPKPSYTKEARRKGVQGFVTLRVLLSARGKVGRVRVVKGLPAGLTENAMRAACKIEFKPARKNSQPVAEWVTAEYIFRLADSSIFTP